MSPSFPSLLMIITRAAKNCLPFPSCWSPSPGCREPSPIHAAILREALGLKVVDVVKFTFLSRMLRKYLVREACTSPLVIVFLPLNSALILFSSPGLYVCCASSVISWKTKSRCQVHDYSIEGKVVAVENRWSAREITSCFALSTSTLDLKFQTMKL